MNRLLALFSFIPLALVGIVWTEGQIFPQSLIDIFHLCHDVTSIRTANPVWEKRCRHMMWLGIESLNRVCAFQSLFVIEHIYHKSVSLQATVWHRLDNIQKTNLTCISQQAQHVWLNEALAKPSRPSLSEFNANRIQCSFSVLLKDASVGSFLFFACFVCLMLVLLVWYCIWYFATG